MLSQNTKYKTLQLNRRYDKSLFTSILNKVQLNIQYFIYWQSKNCLKIIFNNFKSLTFCENSFAVKKESPHWTTFMDTVVQ